jgi:hypothetical protein
MNTVSWELQLIIAFSFLAAFLIALCYFLMLQRERKKEHEKILQEHQEREVEVHIEREEDTLLEDAMLLARSKMYAPAYAEKVKEFNAPIAKKAAEAKPLPPLTPEQIAKRQQAINERISRDTKKALAQSQRPRGVMRSAVILDNTSDASFFNDIVLGEIVTTISVDNSPESFVGGGGGVGGAGSSGDYVDDSKNVEDTYTAMETHDSYDNDSSSSSCDSCGGSDD